MESSGKIVLAGGAGLVGQNLVVRLKAQGLGKLVVLDKHAGNLAILRKQHPDIVCEDADLAEPGDWERHLDGAAALVMLQAQIGDLKAEPFLRNNVQATRVILDAMDRQRVPYLVHISSSVVASVADDHYTRTKRDQEALVIERGRTASYGQVILRPTLMFGWFDRKHLGWLARFMKRVPVFPIPGNGRFMRQPLYVGDFAQIIVQCLTRRITGGPHNISGLERVDYVDIIRTIRDRVHARTLLLHIPVPLFAALLKGWALFDRNPPFTADQLTALIAGDEFEVIDWPAIFGVTPTPFAQAIDETFNDPRYSAIELAF